MRRHLTESPACPTDSHNRPGRPPGRSIVTSVTGRANRGFASLRAAAIVADETVTEKCTTRIDNGEFSAISDIISGQTATAKQRHSALR